MPKVKAHQIFPDRDFLFHYSSFSWGHPAELTQQVLVFDNGVQMVVSEVICEACRLNGGRAFRMVTAESVQRHARQHAHKWPGDPSRWPVLNFKNLGHIDLPREPAISPRGRGDLR